MHDDPPGIMILLAFCIGIFLPAANGWLLLRLIEGRTPVLLRWERWALGFVCGLTATMFLTFLSAEWVHLPLTRAGFLAVQLIPLTILAIALRLRVPDVFRNRTPSSLPASPSVARWAAVLLVVLGVWTAGKIAVGTAQLVLLPPSFDDTVKNWDFRGKIFFMTQAFTNTVPGGTEDIVGQLHSYPPTVSLAKAWLAALAGRWSDGLADSIHAVWFVCLLVMLYGVLRRSVPPLWALLGVYLLTSLPLALMHGTQAYAEVFLAAHLLAAVGLLFRAAQAEREEERLAFLRLAALAAALLPFTKNEGLVLYLPIILVLWTGTLFWMRKTSRLSSAHVRGALFRLAVPLALIALPWLVFKWMNGLTFGNAHALSGTTFSWHENVLFSIAINLFFEGNWLLLFPLLLAALLLRRSDAFRSPLLILTAAILLAFLLQISVFLFTPLATEALFQTGYSRGVVHVAPLAAALLTLLTFGMIRRNE